MKQQFVQAALLILPMHHPVPLRGHGLLRVEHRQLQRTKTLRLFIQLPDIMMFH